MTHPLKEGLTTKPSGLSLSPRTYMSERRENQLLEGALWLHMHVMVHTDTQNK